MSQLLAISRNQFEPTNSEQETTDNGFDSLRGQSPRPLGPWVSSICVLFLLVAADLKKSQTLSNKSLDPYVAKGGGDVPVGQLDRLLNGSTLDDQPTDASGGVPEEVTIKEKVSTVTGEEIHGSFDDSTEATKSDSDKTADEILYPTGGLKYTSVSDGVSLGSPIIPTAGVLGSITVSTTGDEVAEPLSLARYQLTLLRSPLEGFKFFVKDLLHCGNIEVVWTACEFVGPNRFRLIAIFSGAVWVVVRVLWGSDTNYDLDGARDGTVDDDD
ncbi:hypothetical protein AAG570_001555 [Ranatra chinensis]|uniref:Uncharacterized protein n=1 Tax=Ranatra chinensis TaxID=642074 RepID=A0ABD0Y946_9HEMI